MHQQEHQTGHRHMKTQPRATLRNSSVCGASGAPPLRIMRTRPPRRAASLENTTRSKSGVACAQGGRDTGFHQGLGTAGMRGCLRPQALRGCRW